LIIVLEEQILEQNSKDGDRKATEAMPKNNYSRVHTFKSPIQDAISGIDP